MKVIIAGGGTGGHVFPAIALAQHIKEQIKDSRIIFIGTEKGLESSVVTDEGFELRHIRSKGLVGKNFKNTMHSLSILILSFYDSYRIIKEVKPQIVIGVGGYSSGAVVMTAFLMGIPTMIHEQNSVPGLANKLLSRFSQATAISYEESRKFFPSHKVHFTGNPVRKEIACGDRQKGYERFGLHHNRFTVFVFGGSLGAHTINNALIGALDNLTEMKNEIQFLHQTGKHDIDMVQKAYEDKGFKATVLPFIKEMAYAYAIADLVICRAGAITLAEITLCGKASILIPYPFAAGNHQLYNAERLSKKSAAILIPDHLLNADLLSQSIKNLMRNTEELRKMEKASAELGKTNAEGKNFELMMQLVKSPKIS